MKLVRDNGSLLFSDLVLAKTFWQRTVGLLNRRELSPHEALWIRKCNWIHTFFMKFAIDCIFLDEKGSVKKIYHNVQPWRLAGPAWGADSVIEIAAGQALQKNVNVGETLICGP